MYLINWAAYFIKYNPRGSLKTKLSFLTMGIRARMSAPFEIPPLNQE